MKFNFKKITSIILCCSLLSAQTSFAARLGKGRNSGMYRSNINTQRYSNPQPGPTYSNNSANQAQPQRRGPGFGAVAAGAAAGAVGGYMLGKAMNSQATERANSSQEISTQATENSNNSIPWGIISILGMLLVIGLVIFRRKSLPQTNPSNILANSSPNPASFEIPTVRKENTNYANSAAAYAKPSPLSNPNLASANLVKMVDGVETQYFLRQAKGMFLHIQSMNSPDNFQEIEKYLSPELYTELKGTIADNDYVADFSQLECQLLDSSLENDNYLASVRFTGQVSEAPNTPLQDFNEIWHFVKPKSLANAKWKVAGIQQQ